jgi:hypothetical protein
MTSREDLINELTDKFNFEFHFVVEDIADWIIADRARIVEPLVKWKQADPYTVTRVPLKAIDETLKLAGVEQ